MPLSAAQNDYVRAETGNDRAHDSACIVPSWSSIVDLNKSILQIFNLSFQVLSPPDRCQEGDQLPPSFSLAICPDRRSEVVSALLTSDRCVAGAGE